MKRYLLQYQRKVEDIMNYDDLDTDFDSDLQEAFKKCYWRSISMKTVCCCHMS